MKRDIDEFFEGLEENERDYRKENWVFEHPISDNRKLIGQVHIQGKPDLIRNIRRRLSSLSNTLGLSRNALMKKIFNAGLEVLEAQVKTGKVGDLAELSNSYSIDWEISQQIKRIHEKQAVYKDLILIYHDLGPDEFTEFCTKNQIDYEDFLKIYSWKSESLKVSQRDRDFLRNYLFERGEVNVSEIRTAALSEGIIEDEDTDWKRLSKTAERMGLIGGAHGSWRLPGKATL